MSGTKRTLVAVAPDGTKITYQTSGGYDYAGLIKYRDGGWSLRAKGWSQESVNSNARRACYRTVGATEWAVVPFHERTAPVLTEYFARYDEIDGRTERPQITSLFAPGKGWFAHPPYPGHSCEHKAARIDVGASEIRRLNREGVTDVCVSAHGHHADFTIESLLKSLAARTRRCATVGHGDRKATHQVSYNYRGEEETTTEYVCMNCALGYRRRPVLQNFRSVAWVEVPA